MKAILTNFRRGVRTMKGNEMIAEPENMKDSKKLIGKKVVYKTSGKKQINGKVAGTHGNKGAIRIKFIKGMPGQAIGQKVEIIE